MEPKRLERGNLPFNHPPDLAPPSCLQNVQCGKAGKERLVWSSTDQNGPGATYRSTTHPTTINARDVTQVHISGNLELRQSVKGSENQKGATYRVSRQDTETSLPTTAPRTPSNPIPHPIRTSQRQSITSPTRINTQILTLMAAGEQSAKRRTVGSPRRHGRTRR
jgi:hypothetical protein